MISHFYRSHLLLAVGASFLLGAFRPAHATIHVDDQRVIVTGGHRAHFAYYRDNGNSSAVRMAIATLEGKTYYLYRGQDGNGVELSPADDGQQGSPHQDGSLIVGMTAPGSGVSTVSYPVALLPRDGLLYAVWETAGQDPASDRFYGNHIYIQAFKTQENTLRLKEVGDLQDIAPVGNALLNGTALNGDDGIYIHAIYRNGTGGNVWIRSFLMRNSSKPPELVSQQNDILPSSRGLEPAACDSIATHEFDSAHNLQEVHYIVWASLPNNIWLSRYLPKSGNTTAATYQTGQTPYTIYPRNSNNSSVLTLVEGGMNGDGLSDYGCSMVEMADDGSHITVIRELSLSSTAHTFVGGWSPTDFALTTGKLASGACVHFGIDKARVVPRNGETIEQFGQKFTKAMEQSFRISVLTFHTNENPPGIADEKYTSFRSGVIRGNLFVTPQGLANDGTTQLDTEKTAAGDTAPPFGAWTLIGVIHGIPPYLPYTRGQSYPNVTFTYNKTTSSGVAISNTTEDTKEVTVAASIGGEVGKAIFSTEGSYSYGVKAVTGSSSTTTFTRSETETKIFSPNPNTAPPYPPDEIGVLFYTTPTFVSKMYSVRRWNGDVFTDGTTRSIFLTVVAGRESHSPVLYLLDRPDLGPLMGNPVAPNAAWADLTKGIDPVPRTSQYNQWQGNGPVKDIGKYAQIPNAIDGGAVVSADTAFAGAFSLSYTYVDSQGHTQALTKTHKGTIKVGGGIKGLFNISVTGAYTNSQTLSTTSTETTSIGTGIASSLPQLWKDPDDPSKQPISSLKVRALVVTAKEGDDASWIPTYFKGSSSPYLLTWQLVNLDPPRFQHKPWKVPGRDAGTRAADAPWSD